MTFAWIGDVAIIARCAAEVSAFLGPDVETTRPTAEYAGIEAVPVRTHTPLDPRAGLVALIEEGLSAQEIARQTGADPKTVAARRRAHDGNVRCPCGSSAVHRGRCRVRRPSTEGATVVVGGDALTLAGHYAKDGRLARVVALLCAGGGVRPTARTTGAHRDTVARVARQLLALGLVPASCLCGRLAFHRGCCRERRDQAA